MTIGAEPGYELRPESLESAYYLYRLTGDARYRRMGAAMWPAIDRWTRTDAGFAALADVRTRSQAGPDALVPVRRDDEVRLAAVRAAHARPGRGRLQYRGAPVATRQLEPCVFDAGQHRSHGEHHG